jgi:hypothetical protein
MPTLVEEEDVEDGFDDDDADDDDEEEEEEEEEEELPAATCCKAAKMDEYSICPVLFLSSAAARAKPSFLSMPAEVATRVFVKSS